MSTAREAILARIRAATAAIAAPAPIPRNYLTAHHDHDIVALFAERAADYRAVVARVGDPDVQQAIADAIVERPGRFIAPAGFPAHWLPDALDVAADDPPLSAVELDRLSGVITGCTVAVAETGTVILSHGPGEGRRALTLVPDFHLVVVRADQVAADLSGALARLDPARPHTMISGPSATSDIELIRVEGVHGPRTLHIVIAG
ncbi:MAG TPA: LUD domain-containing protein [Streptosporangiaceae bacterium]|nr:LUD domain-containing protein [Streptosporangiaceae bacterium]